MAKRSDEALYAYPELSDVLAKNKLKQAKITKLLKRAAEIKPLLTELKDIKAELIELGQDIGEARIDKYCFRITWSNGRKTLDKGLLVENGVTPAQIQNSYRTSGDGNWKLELDIIGESGGDDED